MKKISLIKVVYLLATISICLTLTMVVYYPFPFGVGLRITALTYPLVISALLVLAARKIKVNGFPANLSISLGMLFFMVITLLMSTLLNVDDLVNQGPFSFLFLFLFAMLLAVLTISLKLERFLLIAYLVVSFTVSVMVLYNYFFVEHFYYLRTSIKINDIVRDPNYVGAYIAAAPTLLYFLVFYLNKKTRVKRYDFVAILAIIVYISSIVALGSRSVLLSMMLPLVMLYIYNNYKRKSIRFIFTIPIASLSLFLVSSFFLDSRFLTKDTEELSDLGIRSEIWNNAIEQVLKNPILGAGLSADIKEATFGYATHNVYIDIALFGGLIAVFFFLGFILSITLLLPREKILISILLVPLFLPIASINGFSTFAFWLPIIMAITLYSFINRLGIARTS